MGAFSGDPQDLPGLVAKVERGVGLSGYGDMTKKVSQGGGFQFIEGRLHQGEATAPTQGPDL